MKCNYKTERVYDPPVLLLLVPTELNRQAHFGEETCVHFDDRNATSVCHLGNAAGIYSKAKLRVLSELAQGSTAAPASRRFLSGASQA